MPFVGKNSEDKDGYCEYAAKVLEPSFVKKFGIGGILNMPIMINPEKKVNKYAIDFISLREDRKKIDLKVEETPFFTSSKYGVNPQNAFTINVFDIMSYIKKGQDIGILIWQNFEKDMCEYDSEIFRSEGVYYTTAQEIHDIPNKKIRVISRRINDLQGNKPDSYVLDVTRFRCLYSSRNGVVEVLRRFRDLQTKQNIAR
jgi:hypothetical protein